MKQSTPLQAGPPDCELHHELLSCQLWVLQTSWPAARGEFPSKYSPERQEFSLSPHAHIWRQPARLPGSGERERESLVSLMGLSFIAVHLQLPTFINRRQTTTLHYNQQLRVTLFVRIFGNNLCICSTIRYAEDVMTLLLYWEVFCSGLSHDDWNTHSLPRNSVRVVSTITEKPVYLSSHLTSSQQSGIYVRRSRVKNLWNIPPHFYKLLNMSFLTRRNTDVVPIAQKYSLLNLVNTSFFVVQFIQRFSFYETSAVRSLVRFTDRNEY